MRRYRRKRKNNKIIIIGSLCLLLCLCVGYVAFSTNLSITAKGNIKEKSRVIQAWSSTDQTDFHSDFYKQNIVSATFLDNANVPSNAVESWNVSEDVSHGGVMAWVIPNSGDSTKYDLYIGANDGVIANEESYYLFYNFVNIKNINFNNNYDTSNVINMYGMFLNCRELSVLDLTIFNTQNVTNMANMFASGDITQPMKIETIIFGEKFITSSVTNMVAMFGNCNYLKNLDVSNFDTSNVVNMHDMFASCHSLTTLDLSSWNTSKVTDMHGMFFSCRNLTDLNLCSFDISNVKDMASMFSDSFKLEIIRVSSNWTTDNANTTNIFLNSGVSSVTTGQC